MNTTEEKQKFLDSSQYTDNGILRYEKVFGHGFVSTGGKETTTDMLDLLKLKPDDYVLDIGCGIGGSMFMMNKKFGCKALGLDLSTNMLRIGEERKKEWGVKDVEFVEADCTVVDYPENTFDVIYSRDAILHIEDKLSLFKQFMKWLKPGGRVLITDYCATSEKWTDSFQAYVKQRNYFLIPVETYGEQLAKAGFSDVKAEDRSWQFEASLRAELNRMESEREEFLKDFTPKDLDDLVSGWKAKLDRLDMQKWGLFMAVKPSTA